MLLLKKGILKRFPRTLQSDIGFNLRTLQRVIRSLDLNPTIVLPFGYVAREDVEKALLSETCFQSYFIRS